MIKHDNIVNLRTQREKKNEVVIEKASKILSDKQRAIRNKKAMKRPRLISNVGGVSALSRQTSFETIIRKI